MFDRIAAAQVAAVAPELESRKTAIIAGSGSVCLAFAAALARVKTEVIAICPKTTIPEHKLLLRMHRLELMLVEGGLADASLRAEADASASLLRRRVQMTVTASTQAEFAWWVPATR